jgi:hypothetical protein
LPKREELSFLIVFAFPKAYKISLQPRILSYIPTNLESLRIVLDTLLEIIFDKVLSFTMLPIFLPNDAKNFKQDFVFSVFPAPDYPLMTID